MRNTSCRSAIAKDLTWKLDTAGVLTISGTGRIPDYGFSNNPSSPWEDRKEEVKELVILEGITEIGINAFRDCTNLKKAILPQTLGRIRAYAFRDCTALEEILSPRSEWRYVKDHKEARYQWQVKENDEVVFGLQAFHYCPFAIKKWNNFYIRDDILYVCFSGKDRLIIPAGVKIIHQFAAADLTVDDILCPDTLDRIERFAFSRTFVRRKITLPDEMTCIDPYAFADCIFHYIKLPKNWVPESMKRRRMHYDKEKAKFIDLKRIPKLNGRYYLGIGRSGELKIFENKVIHHKDRTITAIWDNNYIDVWTAILHKLFEGCALKCICRENGKVIHKKVLTKQSFEQYRRLPTDKRESIAFGAFACLFKDYPELQANILAEKIDTDKCELHIS